MFFFFFQAEDGIRDVAVTGVQTCALPIYGAHRADRADAQRTQGGGVAGAAPPACGETAHGHYRARLGESARRSGTPGARNFAGGGEAAPETIWDCGRVPSRRPAARRHLPVEKE